MKNISFAINISAIADPVDGVDEKTPNFKDKMFVLTIFDFNDRGFADDKK